jgi:hypothetical protein
LVAALAKGVLGYVDTAVTPEGALFSRTGCIDPFYPRCGLVAMIGKTLLIATRSSCDRSSRPHRHFNSIIPRHRRASASQTRSEPIFPLKTAGFVTVLRQLPLSPALPVWQQTFAPKSPPGRRNLRNPEADFPT